MSCEDLSPAQWRILKSKTHRAEDPEDPVEWFEEILALVAAHFLEWKDGIARLTPAGRIALRLKKKLDELEAGR